MVCWRDLEGAGNEGGAVVGGVVGLGKRAFGAEEADRPGLRTPRGARDGRRIPGRAAVWGGAQDWLASGRAGGLGASNPHAGSVGADPVGGGRSSRSGARLR